MFIKQREFTQKKLIQHNGKHGAPIWIAYAGKVYDLSKSFLWRTGKHQALHSTGADLTKELIEAPQDSEMLDMFPILGALVEDEAN